MRRLSVFSLGLILAIILVVLYYAPVFLAEARHPPPAAPGALSACSLFCIGR